MSHAVLTTVKYPKIRVKKNNNLSTLRNKGPEASVSSTNYPVTYINTKSHTSTITDKNSIIKIAEVLPFRVRFQTVSIGGYSPSNPAPIGIAVIGLNNYIL